jgi:transcriptional antiterminator
MKIKLTFYTGLINKNITTNELAQILKVTKRTILRDIEKLKSLSYKSYATTV